MTAAPVSPFILIKSAGEMASGIAWRLYMANIRRLCLIDLADPLCVRRTVSFCPALETGATIVEGVEAVAARSADDMRTAWARGRIPVMLTTDWSAVTGMAPDVVVDAIIAKRNTGTSPSEAPLVVGLGPGFTAGEDCHVVVETNRGHHLGRLITQGGAAPNTGLPGEIAGHTAARVLRAPAAGLFRSNHRIGDRVRRDEVVGSVDGAPVICRLDGILRGLIRSDTKVGDGLKLGDVDPRADAGHCHTVSDKARALGGAVLEAVMRQHNRGSPP